MGLRSAGGILVVVVLGLAGAAGAACGSGNETPSPFPGNGMDSGGGNPNGEGGDASGPILGGGDAPSTSTLTITPQNPVIDVTAGGAPGTQQFTALIGGSSAPQPASWGMDNPALGLVDNNGLFTASGTVGGTGNVSAQLGSAMATTTVTVHLHLTENPGNVDPGTQGKLQAGGSADATFKWLYPYDKTVFPRGLTAPVLQFNGTASDATLVRVTVGTGAQPKLDYSGFFAASNPVQAAPTAAAWLAITESAAGGDPVKVAVTKISGGQVTGPITETWGVAQGSLKGTVYYNSYSSPLGGNTGTVLKMKPGTPATVLVGGGTGCQVCHEVSSDGSTLAVDGPGPGSPYTSGTSYSLSAAGATPMFNRADSQFAFGGLYPDGTLLATNASLPGSWPPNVPGIGQSGALPSQLLDPKTGAPIPAPGLDGLNALMPAFSPDGKKLAFNHYDVSQGHTLAVMDFALATHTFTGMTDVVTDPSSYLGWPAFLPDSKEFVFHAVDGQDYATWQSHHADIKIVDTATKTVTPLDALNGYAGGQPYLPQGATEAHLNYEPTSLPVAVGGYYWVVFTSRRFYGNTIGPATDPDPWGSPRRKKLWVAAIDINPTPGKDPSHPAFYINDQELAAGNMRGFWALDPCKQNGNSCGSGDECCTGFCRQANVDGGSALVCVPPPSGCAQEFEKCNVTADCCGASQGFQCINGFCARPTPQ